MDPQYHANSSLKSHPELDFNEVHAFHLDVDASKRHTVSVVHRALYHHKEGIEFLLPFHNVPASIGLQHLREDVRLGLRTMYDLTLEKWLQEMAPPGSSRGGYTPPWDATQHMISRFGGDVETWKPMADWFNLAPNAYPQYGTRTMVLRHHTQGIFDCMRVFGPTYMPLEGGKRPTRLLAESWVRESVGSIPSTYAVLRCVKPARWMRPPRELKA